MRAYDKLGRLPAPGDGDYQRRLAVALTDTVRNTRDAFGEIDRAPCLSMTLGASQALTVNTLTTIAFDTTAIDTHSWWNAATGTYTPKLAGIYRASWGLNFKDTAAFATSTYGWAQCGGRVVLRYGNGAALGIDVSGSALVDCDGASTGIKVEGLILAGTAPVAFASVPVSCWLDVNYVGRKR